VVAREADALVVDDGRVGGRPGRHVLGRGGRPLPVRRYDRVMRTVLDDVGASVGALKMWARTV
jgi:hypothetical protein